MSSHEDVELVPDVTVEHLARAVLFAALTAVLAQASIQLPGGIPFSFQPFGVFLAALVLGPLWGGFSLALYVLAGVAGAPIFSNGAAGLGVVAGPTGGFLVGFLLAAVAIGAVAHRRVEPRPVATLSTPVALVALLAGMAIMYAVGIPWFASVQGWSLPRAATFLAPFALGDCIKVAITVGVVRVGGEAIDRA